MTQKISPISLRLGVSSSWLSSSHLSPLNLPLVLHSDLFIRSLIQGIFLKFSFFTSPIIIHRSPNGSLDIKLFFWDASSSSLSPSLFQSFNIPLSSRYLVYKYISQLDKNINNPVLKHSKKKIVANIVYLLLSKLLNSSNISCHFSEIPSPVYNAKILCDYLAYRISLNPYYHKPVVMEAIRASKYDRVG